MQSSLFILGRQPALGLAELEILYGSELVQPIGNTAAIVLVDPENISFDRLGGSIKLAAVLKVIDETSWEKIVDYVASALPIHLHDLPNGKLKLGLSIFGLNVPVAQINQSALQIKKVIIAAGRSVRVIPNSEQSLNSAQVLHNQLTSPLGMELLFIRNGNSTIIAQTIREQNIDAYAARDQMRPKRDARVGMLPPKLAQTIVNLSTGQNDINETSIILDPFCGTGVVLQEAILMGAQTYGTDLEQRMIDYSQENMDWLKEKWQTKLSFQLKVGDATDLQWDKPISAIACETYLGRPFSSLPDQETLQGVMQDVNLIIKRFLQNVVRQTEAGFPLCIAVPAWKTPEGFKHLKLLDSLEELGYTRHSFVHVRDQDLIYFREGQVVARELVVLKRI